MIMASMLLISCAMPPVSCPERFHLLRLNELFLGTPQVLLCFDTFRDIAGYLRKADQLALTIVQ